MYAIRSYYVFEDGSKLEADLTMFIAAGTGSALLKNTDLPLSEAGFVKINNYNQVEAFPHVFAIGDAAAYEGPEWIAKQGHIAEIMGSVITSYSIHYTKLYDAYYLNR